MSVETVLFVDDDPDIRTIGEMSLGLVGGFHVLLASSGEQALELARSASPDVIVLDVMMPGLDGLATLARLRADPAVADIPVVLLTARVGPGSDETFDGSGALGVIPKPFDPLALAGQVRELVARGREVR